MKYLFLFISLFLWTEVQGAYNQRDGTIELTYEDLEQELAEKRRHQQPEVYSPLAGISHVDAVFGYSFASLAYKLPSRSQSFVSNGVDLRLTGHIENSLWQIEGGFKNYSESRTGDQSASSQIITTTLKYQDVLQNSTHYILGGGSSLHLIDIRDTHKRRSAGDWSLNFTTGVRGTLTSKFNWGLDINAYSPLSGQTLKSGVDTSIMLSTSL